AAARASGWRSSRPSPRRTAETRARRRHDRAGRPLRSSCRSPLVRSGRALGLCTQAHGLVYTRPTLEEGGGRQRAPPPAFGYQRWRARRPRPSARPLALYPVVSAATFAFCAVASSDVILPAASAASIWALRTDFRAALKPEFSAVVVTPSFAATPLVVLSR